MSSLFQRGKELKEKLSLINSKRDEKKKPPSNLGCISGDCINGEGIYIAPDGTRIEGRFCMGELQGEGCMITSNGKQYEGHFEKGRLHGEGIIIYPTGTKYVGQFVDGKRYGHGTMTYANGFKYEGQFINNKPNGQGILVFPDGKRYEGEFENGKFCGHGIMCYPNGTKYVGEFKDDKRHGQGSLTYPNGFKYMGEFTDNKCNGQGTLIFPDGTKYVGQFQNDRRDGHGSVTYSNNLKYIGQFKDDKYHGQGTLIFPDGTIYEGNFVDDRYHGHGIITTPDGSKWSGFFVHGNLQCEGEFPEDKPAETDIDPKCKVVWIEKGDVKKRNILKDVSYEKPLTIENSDDKHSNVKPETKHRASDGHYVRSKAEMLVDNWLYMVGIVHVYEKKLPIEEDVCSTFYLPNGKVYIEYWVYGNENSGKKRKVDIYKKYKLNLIELNHDDIYNLDEVLTKKLLQFNVHPS